VSLGQTLITLGMLILLILTVISANRMLTDNIGAQLGSEAVKYSASIASDVFAEIGSKPFDRTVKGAVIEIDTVLVDPSHYVLDTVWVQDTTGTVPSLPTNFSTYQGVYWGVSSKSKIMQTTWNYSSHLSSGQDSSLHLPDFGMYTDITNTGYRRTNQFKSKTALKDVDDYDGYFRIVRTPDSLNFTVTVKVFYVISTKPDTLSSSNQFFKRIAVTVSLNDSTYFKPATYTTLVSY